MRSPDGSISHIAGTWRDVTEEKKLRSEADYRLQQLVLADKLSSLGEVVAGVAHEVCNPNSFIAYNIPILEETWLIFKPILEEFGTSNPHWQHRSLTLHELFQDMDDTIRHIKTGSDRINRIVSHLKDFIRTEEGAPPRLLQINEVIESAFTIVGAQARKSVALIEKHLEPDIPPVLGFFQKLEQVFTNLLVNALQAIQEKSSGKLTIRTRYLKKHESIMMQVEDNGRGMAPEVVERIFEPFFTLRRESGGTGLGLSVSYNLVQEHKGLLGVLSRRGLGSRFTVLLPASPEARLDIRPAVLCVHKDQGFTRDLAAFFAETGDTLLYTLNDSSECSSFLKQHPEIDILLGDPATLMLAGDYFFTEIEDNFPLITIIYLRSTIPAEEISINNRHSPDMYLDLPFHASQFQTIIKNTARQKL